MLCVCQIVVQESILYLSNNRSAQTRTQRPFSCVYGVVWLEFVSDLPYLSLITQRALLTGLMLLSWVSKCVRYAGDVAQCKCSTDRREMWCDGGK